MINKLSLPQSISGIDLESIYSVENLRTLNNDCEQLIDRIKGVQEKIQARVEIMKNLQFELKRLAFENGANRQEYDFFEQLINGAKFEISVDRINYADSINRKFGLGLIKSIDGIYNVDLRVFMNSSTPQNIVQEPNIDSSSVDLSTQASLVQDEYEYNHDSEIIEEVHNYIKDGYSCELAVDHDKIEKVDGYFLSFFNRENNFTTEVPIDEFPDEVNFTKIAKALPAGFVILKRESFYKVFNFLDPENYLLPINNIFKIKQKGTALQRNLSRILSTPMVGETLNSFEYYTSDFSASDVTAIKKYVENSPCADIVQIKRGHWKIVIKPEFLLNSINPTYLPESKIITKAKLDLDKIWN